MARICLGFFFSCGLSQLCAQQQLPQSADSLEAYYLNGPFEPADSIAILGELTYALQDPQKMLQYSNAYIEMAIRMDSPEALYNGYFRKGTAYRMTGDFAEALKNYFYAANLAIERENDKDLGQAYITIADSYSLMGNTQNASDYYNRAIRILKTTGDSLSVAMALSNAGDEYFNQGKLDSALIYFEESGALFKAVDFNLGKGYYLGSVGMVLGKQGKDSLALLKLNQGLEILREEKDFYGIAAFLPYVADIYQNQNNLDAALRYTHRGLAIAEEYGLKEQISDANLKLSELYEAKGLTTRALGYYKTYTAYKDSINNVDLVQQMAKMRNDFEISQKQAEVDLLEKEAEIQSLRDRKQKSILYVSIGITGLVFLLALGMYYRYRYIKKTSRIIQDEKMRSDNLLKNILPDETAEELKRSGRVKAKKFDSATVMFADFVGFTHHSENMGPEALVQNVDFYFSKFDEIIGKYELEKIKSIGDCYMCASGLPFTSSDHAVRMVKAAMDIIRFVGEVEADNTPGGQKFEIRIGINSGPIVAGVVGTKKFAYDIWGDTVNTAARMEANSSTSKVNISENTFKLVQDHFQCEYRGMISAKNKGMLKMYFVTSEKVKEHQDNSELENVKS
ncbi:adenylate/guanylate cyclase domain-containing protein [Robiginitalea sp. IMCC44478]|uniref:adenylate/guanylate cyclase domain-containing protein n=1 Tax=Robiginitalea sp. IMCC44478 TaxID=3459122 RepID=UPI004042DA03